MTPHPQADLLRAIADGKQMQGRLTADGCDWFDIYPDQAIGAIASGYSMRVRIKPETVLINGIECPAPMRVAPAAQPPAGWPRASISDSCLGWTLDYKFLDKVEQIAKSRTEYSTSMEATEQVLIAALEVLATAPQAAPAYQDALDAARYRYLQSIAVQTADPLGPIFSITIRRIDQDGVWGNVSATIDAHIAAKQEHKP